MRERSVLFHFHCLLCILLRSTYLSRPFTYFFPSLLLPFSLLSSLFPPLFPSSRPCFQAFDNTHGFHQSHKSRALELGQDQGRSGGGREGERDAK